MWQGVRARIFRQHCVVKLGRWAVDSPDNHVARRAELAALDNCGVSAARRRQGVAYGADTPFDNTMDASLCALQSFYVYSNKNTNLQPKEK